MSIGSFFKLVEIQTKIASMTPFLLGSIFAVYRYNQFSLSNFIMMFISLLSFDMATTTINNYIDYKKASKTHGYGYEQHNAIVRDNLKESTVITVIVVLLAIAVSFGILLYLNTSLLVLIIGVISFAVGILYTFGPIPISRIPLGEIFSGLFMGFVIIFLSAYIHIVDLNLFELSITNSILILNINLYELLVLFLIALPATLGIAVIMLANNICDIEDDLENKRYTLPIYIGKAKALKLFKALYYIAFADIVVLLLLGIMPLITIPALLTVIPVKKNIDLFMKLQSKKDTFVVAIKNFVLINASLVILLLGSGLSNLHSII
jgi:1,4-dihydroxy-2-naphthoate octaprenyltransferase